MAEYKLQGHEKFTLREGWLNKGMQAVKENPKIFSDKYATDVLGVGSNMVKSIRYWLKAFNLVVDKPTKGTFLTNQGQVVYDNDPYFEKDFTIWLLHSSLVKNKSFATVWYLFFNKCDVDEISKEELEKHIKKELIMMIDSEEFSDKSLKTDIDVLLNMYGKAKKNDNPEEKNVSPLAKLKLVAVKENNIHKLSPDLRKINEWNILYDLACRFEKTDNISIDDIASGEESIGSIYNLSRIATNQYLDKLDALGYIKVDRTAGLDMVYKAKEFNQIEVAKEFYNNN